MKRLIIVGVLFFVLMNNLVSEVELLADVRISRHVPAVLETHETEESLSSEKGKVTLVVRLFLRNSGETSAEVATIYEIDSINRQNTISVTRNAMAYESMLVKPAPSELGIVALDADEIAFIGESTAYYLNQGELPKKIFINYYCAEELKEFYTKLDVGEKRIAIELDGALNGSDV